MLFHFGSDSAGVEGRRDHDVEHVDRFGNQGACLELTGQIFGRTNEVHKGAAEKAAGVDGRTPLDGKAPGLPVAPQEVHGREWQRSLGDVDGEMGLVAATKASSQPGAPFG